MVAVKLKVRISVWLVFRLVFFIVAALHATSLFKVSWRAVSRGGGPRRMKVSQCNLVRTDAQLYELG